MGHGFAPERSGHVCMVEHAPALRFKAPMGTPCEFRSLPVTVEMNAVVLAKCLSKSVLRSSTGVGYPDQALKCGERVLAVHHGPELRARVSFDLANSVSVLGVLREELAHAGQDVVVVLAP